MAGLYVLQDDYLGVDDSSMEMEGTTTLETTATPKTYMVHTDDATQTDAHTLR